VRTFISIGAGVNSTAILALIKLGKLQYENPIAMFADTGGEKPETYEYLAYLQTVSPLPIQIIKGKEGSLWEYCKERKILPMRHLRWCSDRWKQKPLTNFRKANLDNREEFITIMGIDYGEKHRINRWKGDIHAIFPLIDLQMDRKDCIAVIKQAGWKVPAKSGCFFCPNMKPMEFGELKIKYPDLFKELCELEKKVLGRFKEYKAEGWYNEKYPIPELVNRKCSATVEGQMCLYCKDW
jgi:hypothetical protein